MLISGVTCLCPVPQSTSRLSLKAPPETGEPFAAAAAGSICTEREAEGGFQGPPGLRFSLMGVLARAVLNQFGKSPPPFTSDPPQYLIRYLILLRRPRVMSDHPSLSSARLLTPDASPESLHPLTPSLLLTVHPHRLRCAQNRAQLQQL